MQKRLATAPTSLLIGTSDSFGSVWVLYAVYTLLKARCLIDSVLRSNTGVPVSFRHVRYNQASIPSDAGSCALPRDCSGGLQLGDSLFDQSSRRCGKTL